MQARQPNLSQPLGNTPTSRVAYSQKSCTRITKNAIKKQNKRATTIRNDSTNRRCVRPIEWMHARSCASPVRPLHCVPQTWVLVPNRTDACTGLRLSPRPLPCAAETVGARAQENGCMHGAASEPMPTVGARAQENGCMHGAASEPTPTPLCR